MNRRRFRSITDDSDDESVDPMTAAWIEKIVTRSLDNYEEKVGKPRHDANVRRFDTLEDVLQQFKGAMKVCGAALTLIAAVYTVTQIIHLMKS